MGATQCIADYDYELDRNNTLPGVVAGNSVQRTRGEVRRDEKGYFTQLELTSKTDAFGIKHQFRYGPGIGRQSKDQFFRSRANIDSVDLYNPGAKPVPAIPPATAAGF